jgi:type II restriction enzyme
MVVSKSIRQNQLDRIRELLSRTISEKVEMYARETTYMPFLSRIIQADELVAAYSFIHSVATTLGMSVYEEMAKLLLVTRGVPENHVHLKYKLGGQISDGQRAAIAGIVSDLSNGASFMDRMDQVNRVLNARSSGDLHTPKPSTVDLFYKYGDEEFYVDIKTAKPNIGGFKEFKRQLLEWVARRNASVSTLIALPYNPYHPEPYERFTVKGLLIPGEEMKIGEEFWNDLAGWPIYEDLLNTFNEVGQSLHHEVMTKIRGVASDIRRLLKA